jgi:DNA topoisomerase-1
MPPNKLSLAAKSHQRRARKMGLIYINDGEPGISRRKHGNYFDYLSSSGQKITAKKTLDRIKDLVIPPAWKDVWICRSPQGHLQVTGRDEADRKQYIYHADWDSISSSTKYDQLALIAQLLPRVRRHLNKDLGGRKLTKKRVLAAVVRLIDKAHIRMGNDRYEAQNGSHGVTTLKKKHVEVDHFTISLDFPGKSGQRRELELTDSKVAKVIQQCQSIRGQHLFSYRDDEEKTVSINSTDVNKYLMLISGEALTAKDFRTWWGSVIALSELAEIEPKDEASGFTESEVKKAISAAIATTAEILGNTKAVCRSHYIHPGILTAFSEGKLPKLLKQAGRSKTSVAGLTQHEVHLKNLLPLLDSKQK